MAAITSKILTSIITLAGKQGYAALSKKFGFYKFLSDLGIARPKDDFGQLYLQTVVLFAAKGRPKELIELILLEDSKKAFWKEIFEDESGAFINLLDRELHVNQMVREIKSWNEIPFELVADFFEIYDELTGKVSTPVQNKIIKQSEAISDQVKTGFSQMQQKLDMLLETTGNDPLEKEYNRQLSLHIEKIEKGLYLNASEALREMKQEILDKVKPELKFKILTNLGYCLYQLGKNSEATEVLIEAYGHQPESKIALSNMVNAFLAQDDEKQTEKYLELLKQKYPEAPEYYTAFLKLKCYDYTMQELEDMLPQGMMETHDGLVALGLCARNKELFRESITYLERAKSLGEEQSNVSLHLIQNYLEYYQTDFKLANLELLDEEAKVELEYALGLVDAQIEKISTKQLPNLLVQLYLAKSFLHHVLKQPELFDKALNEGLRIEPENKLLLKQKGIALAFNGKPKEAIEILLKISDPAQFPDLPIILSETYRNMGNSTKAMETLESHFAAHPNDDRFSIQGRYILLCMYLNKSDDEKVRQWMQFYGDKLAILDRISSAKALWYLGERETASKQLLATIEELMIKGTYREKFTMVECLVDQKLFDKATDVLESIADFRTPSILTQQLINLYLKQGRNFDALKFLVKMRVYNGPVDGFTTTEIRLLRQAKSYKKARRIAREYVNAMPEDWEVQLLLSATNIRLDLFTESDAFLTRTDVPYLSFSIAKFKLFVGQLAARSLWDNMLTAVYEYRRAKNDVYAHSLYVEALNQFPELARKNIVPDEISLDTVVILKNKAGDQYVLIIEDRATNELKESEINPENPKYEKLLGMKVGEMVEFDGNFSPWEVEKLNNKYSHAYDETGLLLKTKFAETATIKIIHVDEFWQFLESLQKDPEWKQKRAEFWDLYYEHKVTLGGLANLLDCSPIEAWVETTSDPRGLKVASGTPEEMNNSTIAITQKKLICADITALLSLFQLDCATQILEIFGKLYITESTYDLIFNHDQSLAPLPKGKPKLGRFLEFVKNSTIRQQPRQLIGINWIEQQKNHEWLGLEFYETALLAKELGAIFYSDDYIFRTYAERTYHIACAWTQSFLNYAFERNLIPNPVYQQALLILINKRYIHTSISVHTLFESFIQTNYKVNDVTEKCLGVLSGNWSNLESATAVVIDTLIELWTKVPVKLEDKSDITRSMFIALINGRTPREVMFVLKKWMTLYHQTRNTNESAYFLLQAGGILKSISDDFLEF